MFTLRKVLHRVPLEKRIQNVRVSDVCDDTRCVRKGALFFVRPGKNFDIFPRLNLIEGKVAAFVVSAKDKKKVEGTLTGAPVVFVKDVAREFVSAIDAMYGFNNKDFIFIGVTGTKGKTTVTHLIYELLNRLGKRTALIGTIHYLIGGAREPASHTTPDYLALRKLFRRMKAAHIKFVVMEVSSHGIAQGRVKGIDFARRVFTNLSREHLDYHKTMQGYFEAKRAFFLNDRHGAHAIVNIDDAYGGKLAGELKASLSYGQKACADFRARKLVLGKRGVDFILAHKGSEFAVSSRLVGSHNVENILAAIATVHSLGFPLTKIVPLVGRFRGVEGRLQEIQPDVFVDYAHTPDSLEKTLGALRQVGYKKIICVFGCGGNRDKGKRKVMGTVASRRADHTIITSDNPRQEDPMSICKAIEKGFTRKNYTRIPDRKKAIKEGLRLQKKMRHSCLVVAGKGHEAYQLVKGDRIPFKDSLIIKELTR